MNLSTFSLTKPKPTQETYAWLKEEFNRLSLDYNKKLKALGQSLEYKQVKNKDLIKLESELLNQSFILSGQSSNELQNEELTFSVLLKNNLILTIVYKGSVKLNITIYTEDGSSETQTFAMSSSDYTEVKFYLSRTNPTKIIKVL